MFRLRASGHYVGLPPKDLSFTLEGEMAQFVKFFGNSIRTEPAATRVLRQFPPTGGSIHLVLTMSL